MRLFLLLVLIAAGAAAAYYFYLRPDMAPQTSDPDTLYSLCTDNILDSVQAVSSCSAYLSITGLSDTDRKKAYRARAEAYLSQGRYDQAAADYGEAITLDPDDISLIIDRGEANRSWGRNSDALNDFTSAIESDPTSARAHFSRGILHRDAGRANPAIADLTRVIELDGNVSAAHFFRGLLYLEEDQEAMALSDFDAAIETAMFTFAEAHIQRALIRANRGNLEEAVQDLDAAYSYGSPQLVSQFQTAAASTGHFAEQPNGTYGETTKAALKDCLSDETCRKQLTN